MGNATTRGDKCSIHDELWKKKILQEKHLQGLARVLPRSPEYLGRVALSMSEIEIEHVIAGDKKTNTTTEHKGDDTGHNIIHDQIDMLKNDINPMQSQDSLQKFKLLMEWKKRCKEPTADKLHQNLWRAGYGERMFLNVLKYNMTGKGSPGNCRKHTHASQRKFSDLTGEGLKEADERKAEDKTRKISLEKHVLKSIIVSHSQPSLRTKSDCLSSEEINLSSFSGQIKGRRKTVAFDLSTDIENENDMIEVTDASTQTEFTVNGQCINDKEHNPAITLTPQGKSQDPSNVKYVSSKTIQLHRNESKGQDNGQTKQISRNKLGREERGHSQEWKSFFEM